MCGLAGLASPGRDFAPPLLDAIEGDLYHRGPDSGGSIAETGWAVAFRRLAIIDPNAQSDQPMTSPDGQVTLVYNGEIYNFRTIRDELESLGARFRTRGDTEVILQGYLFWGEEILNRMEGMFALIIVDRRAARMVVARDPLGIKPLYMTRDKETVAFSSEMRPLFRVTPPVMDPAALGELLTFSWAAGRISNIAGIERVPGGTVIRVDLTNGAVEERRFCDPIDALNAGGAESSVAEADEALDSSLSAHLMSDVGYSLQLSGGIDSSYVAARVHALRGRGKDDALASYGVGIPNYEHDEGRYREMVVDRYSLRHSEEILDGDAFADAMPRAIHHMEGPVPHGGCVMLMLLCAKIRKDGFKVVLTGEGADEFFGGYQRYGDWRRLLWRERLAKLPFAARMPMVPPFVGVRRFAGLDMAAYAALYQRLEPLREVFPDHIPPSPGEREFQSSRFRDFRQRLLAVDQSAYLESLLVRQDKMSMAESIEARVPFVHMPLAKVLNRLPVNDRIPGGTTKPILKRLAERYLPRDLIYRRKIGLWLPYDEWLKDPTKLGRYLDDVAAPNSCLSDHGDARLLRRAVDDFRAGKTTGPRMWTLVNLELWMRGLRRPDGPVLHPS